ncbi:MAG: hypothetical protein ACQES9_07355, partial [Myxococcota bacterium]
MKTFLILFSVIAAFVFPRFMPRARAQFTLHGRYDGLPGNGGSSMDEVEYSQHTNMARCLCDEDNTEDELYSYYFAFNYDGPFDGSDVFFYLGSDCSNTSVALSQCAELASLNINSFNNETKYIPIPVNYLVDPESGTCSEKNSGSSTFYIFSSLENRDTLWSETISYDTRGPAPRSEISASSGENAVTVHWNNDDA